MDELTGQIFSGHLRSIIGSMTVESIIRERQTLAENVLEASKVEMGSLGLIVDSLQIKSIDDKDSGYIDALSAPQRAAVNQAAAIAQSIADQAAAQARQESDRNQAEYARQTAIARAQYQAEIDRAQQEAAQAGPLASARAQQAVLAEQAKVAQRNAQLREAQLQAEVIKPAEAEAERVRIAAEAQAGAPPVGGRGCGHLQPDRPGPGRDRPVARTRPCRGPGSAGCQPDRAERGRGAQRDRRLAGRAGGDHPAHRPRRAGGPERGAPGGEPRQRAPPGARSADQLRPWWHRVSRAWQSPSGPIGP